MDPLQEALDASAAAANTSETTADAVMSPTGTASPGSAKAPRFHLTAEAARSAAGRRPKFTWTADEELCLKELVTSMGKGRWAKILDAGGPRFNPIRTQVDLKDKVSPACGVLCMRVFTHHSRVVVFLSMQWCYTIFTPSPP